ncbi:MAG TPA: DUF2798 domain-containing protein [Noviherbaspirillum sp.]|nr:DUF2798 domain-containing protein [Noviherbaspirillum sp.]
MTALLHASVAPAQLLRRSRALASMLPALLMSGVIMLVMSAVMRLMWIGPGHGFFGAWMEAWLTSWSIAFPLTYLLGPVFRRMARNLAAQDAPAPRQPGLGLADVVNASRRVTRNNRLTVLRNLKPNSYAA